MSLDIPNVNKEEVSSCEPKKDENSPQVGENTSSLHVQPTPESDSSQNDPPKAEPSKACEDIFVSDGECGDSSSAGESPSRRSKPPVTSVDGEDVSSALYEDVPSPGKYIAEPQVNVISQSTNDIQCADSTDAQVEPDSNSKDLESSDGESNRELLNPEPSVTSSDSLFKCTTLNWSAGLDVNIDQLQDDLVDSEKDESTNQVEEPSSNKPITSGSRSDETMNRVPTPDITAQRYRSRTLNIALELIGEPEKVDHRKQTIEIKTKIYSSASAVGTHSSRSSRHGKEGKVSDEKSSKKRSSDGKHRKSSSPPSRKKSKKQKSAKQKEDPANKQEIAKSTSSETSARSKQSTKDKHSNADDKSPRDKSQSHRKRSKTDPTKESGGEKSLHYDKTARDDAEAGVDKHLKRQHLGESSRHAVRRNEGRDATESKEDRSHKSTVFSRLSSAPKESYSLSERFSTFKRADDSNPSDYRSSRQRSHSPRRRDSRRRDSSPTHFRQNREHYPHRHYENDRSRKHKYSSHDNRDERTYTSDRHELDPHYVSPKRYRSEWAPASKVCSLPSKTSVVKTYDLVQSNTTKKDLKQITRTVVTDRSKSPVRFPSPDIKVVDGPKAVKPKPVLVVLSDSD